MQTNTYDAIVVGSGITGGWAAKELTEKGLKVLMLERGRNIEHVKDYAYANQPVWEFPYRDGTSRKMREEFPVLNRRFSDLSARGLGYWANETENPYTEEKPYIWPRGYHVGGRSLMWGRQCYRWSDFDFEANAKDGHGVDWPIRYKDIAPWYDYVESFAGVSGTVEGLPQLPDGKYLPPMDMNIVEKDVAARIRKHFNDKRRMIIGRVANLTQAAHGRSACQYRDMCRYGCPFGAYFSTQSATLPAAVATGNLTLRPFSIVTEILFDKNTKKAKGVRVLDAETNTTYEYFSRVVFLCASTFNSAWVLMNSAKDIWPDGLGSSSGELGHNVMDHPFDCGAEGDVEGYEDKYYYGHRPNIVYIPRFRNLWGEKRKYLRGFGYEGSASREKWSRQIAEMSIGGNLKDALGEPGNWTIGLTAFGEMLPHHDNKIMLDPKRRDKWGLPVLSMSVEVRENENQMRVDMVNDAAEMLEAAGVKNIQAYGLDGSRYTPGKNIHEMGTARMGLDPKTSVLNRHNQLWDCKNVFVTDGACMASSSCVNPSLTYMALTARAADFAVEELKRDNI